jgi:predicted short-subunit dehydrogenase-like oxidoreductase (DUF2520 family)
MRRIGVPCERRLHVARRPSVAIVGCGRVGGAVGIALARKGYTVSAVWSHSRAGRQRAHRLLDAPVLEPAEVAAAGNVVFLTVPDDHIASMASQIAPGVRKGSCVVHTSGGVGVEALDPAREAGAHVASIHPLPTIPDAESGADALAGSAAAVTAEAADRPRLMRIVRAWEGKPFLLREDDKAIYHAAAVFASNYLVSSLWAATALFERIGIAHARELLGPLVRASVDNVLEQGPKKAITGPVARGDMEAVARHAKALGEADPTGGRIADAYGALALLTGALTDADPDVLAEAVA